MPLDIGVGILLPLVVAHLFGFHAGALFIFFGILFILLPDVDILPPLWRTSYDHRSPAHYPALWLVPALLVYWLFGAIYGALFALCILAHFVHDTIGIGWGVAWAWPFSQRKFLFPEAGRRREYGFFMTWLPEAESALAEEYHDPHWVRTYYLRPNPIAYVEYGVFMFSLVVLVLYFWR